MNKIILALSVGALIGASVLAEAADKKTLTGWSLGGDEASCSLYRSRSGQFVFLAIRADSTAMIRVHDKDWPKQSGHLPTVVLLKEGFSRILPGHMAKTSDGWNGIVAEVDRQTIRAFIAADNVTVDIDQVVLGTVELDDISMAALALEECADQLTPSNSHITKSAELVSDLSFDWSELRVSDLPRNPFVFRLIVDEHGIASGCDVVQSSGSPVVDERACTLLQQRARFRPARDNKGEPIISTYQRQIIFRR